MDTLDEIHKEIAAWAERVGELVAEQRLRAEGISPSSVLRLMAGRYPNFPEPLLRVAIKRAMERPIDSAS